MENGPGLKMYFHVFAIENGDIRASYVSLPEGIGSIGFPCCQREINSCSDLGLVLGSRGGLA